MFMTVQRNSENDHYCDKCLIVLHVFKPRILEAGYILLSGIKGHVWAP
jgi:hypothetical protein